MDDETYLRSAHQMSRDLRDRAAECESLRRLPDETVEGTYMQAKVAAYDRSKVADDPFAQRRLSEAAVEIAAAEADMQNTWKAMCAQAEAGETIPLPARARARWSAANIVLRAVRAVDLLFEASGGRALFLDNPMQRYFRDVHAMRAHALNNPDKASQVFGYAELHPGGTPREFFL